MLNFRRLRIISGISKDDGASIFGLIGHNIGYSLSPALHNHFFATHGMNAVYGLFDLDPSDFESNASALVSGASGLNVTVPYKERVIPLLDGFSEEAEKTGSVNLVFRRKGYNTDYMALSKLVEGLNADLKGRECIIFGAGGAARTASFLFGGLGMNIIIVNRSEGRGKKLAKDLQDQGYVAKWEPFPSEPEAYVTRTHCVVNCISSGETVFPEIDAEYVVDFNYGARSRRFRKSLGIPKEMISGEEILIEQAIYSQKIWNRVEPSFEEMREAINVK